MDPNDDQSRAILSSIWPLTGISLVFLLLRVYCKFKGRRGLWWDDYVMILSWISLATSVALATVGVQKGVGKHVPFVPPQNFPFIGFSGNFVGTFSILAAVWSKTSFALTLLRLMQGRMRIVLWLIIISMNIAMDLNAIFLWVRCTPSAKTWQPQIDGTCWEPHVYPTYGLFAAGYSALMDFVLAFLPWRIVWSLQMKKKEKFGVAVAMSLGVAAGATAIVKTVEIPTLASGDFTYANSGLIIWGAAESAVTIMAASIPVLRVLLRDVSALTRNKYNREGSTGKSSRSEESRALRTVRSHKSIVITYPEPILHGGADWQRNPKRETVIYGTTTTIV